MSGNRGYGYLLGFAAIFMWSFNVIISKYMADTLSPIQISFGRWIVASLCVLPFTYKAIWQVRKALLHHWKLVLLLSFGIAFMNNFVYQAGHTTTAIDMSLIATTGPIFLVIISKILFDIPVSKKQVIGFIVALSGVLIVISHGSLTHLSGFHFVIGDFWMILNALTFGTYGALQHDRPKEISPFTLLSATTLIGTILLVPFFIGATIEQPITHFSWEEVGIFIYLGIFNSVLAYLWWNLALDKLGNLKTSLMYYTIPIFSTIEAYFLLNEQIYESQIWGGLLVLGGIFYASYRNRKDPDIERV